MVSFPPATAGGGHGDGRGQQRNVGSSRHLDHPPIWRIPHLIQAKKQRDYDREWINIFERAPSRRASQLETLAPKPQPLCWSDLLTGAFQNADVVQVAVLFGVVQAVSHHKLVRDLESNVARMDGTKPPLGFVQERRDADRLGPPLFQHVHEIIQGHAAIDDVLHDQYVGAFERDVEILCDLHFAGTALPLAVRRDPHKVDKYVALHGACQIRQKKAGALEDADHVEVSVGIITGDLVAEFTDSGLDLLGRDQHSQRWIDHGVYYYPPSLRCVLIGPR